MRTAHAASIDTRKLASRLRLRCDGDHKNALLRVSSTSLHALRCSREQNAHRYAQLLQNLAVRLRAIREAIEVAFGVKLPTAATLNAEFEIITSAIYAAADRPRPAPLTDDKRTTRTHFVYRIDIWTNVDPCRSSRGREDGPIK